MIMACPIKASFKRVKVRLANKADVKDIENIIYDWSKWEHERSKAILNALQDKNHEILVAELNGETVGILHQIFYYDVLHGGLNSDISLLLVKEEFRGRGIGTKLLKEAIKRAKRRSVIELHVSTAYDEAVKFYKKFGFKDAGVTLELPLRN